MAGGTLLIGLAIARLRPVARKLEDGESDGRAGPEPGTIGDS